MESLRQALAKHALDQKEAEILQKQEKHLDLISKLAGKRHHLLGTISNPGVYALPPKDKRPPTEQAIHLQHTILKIPESKIRSNHVLEKWIAENIKNSKKFLKKFHKGLQPDCDSNKKLVQGPFLVILFKFTQAKILSA